MENNKKTIGGDYIDNITQYIKKNRMQTFYNLFLLLVIMIQTPFLIAGLDGVTVELDMPPKGVVIVRNDSANKLYYRIWAEHFTNNNEYSITNKDGDSVKSPYTYSLVDFDYTNVEEKYNNFLKKYLPSKLLKDQNLYKKFIKNVKVKMLSQKFDVEKINVELFDEGKKAETIISGVAHQFSASTKINDKSCQYTMTFERIGGKIYATSLNTNCF